MPLYHRDVDTILLGDMNANNIEDSAFVISPFYNLDQGCRDDSCITEIHFSFDSTVLTHSSALGCQTLFSAEDLNSDGIKEIAFIPNWFQSCWQGIFVYSLKESNWMKIGTGSVYACFDEDFSKRVRKVNSKEFEITSMRWNDDGGEINDTTESFPLN